MKPASVAVIGASGQVGRFVLPLLVRDGWEVLALGRTGRPDDVPDFAQVLWQSSGASTDLPLPDVKALVSAGPIRLALEFLTHHQGVERAVVVSSTSVFSKSASPDPAERSLVRELAAAEEAIRVLCRERDIRCTVLRPTLIYGAGMDDNLTRLWRWIRRHGWLPLASDAHGLRQPLHAADLAQACVHALARHGERELVSPLCGGTTLEYRAMVGRLFEAAERPMRILSLPPGLLAAGVALASRTPWLRGASAEMVRRQSADLEFDDRDARNWLGVAPRSFEPVADDFSPPTAARIEALAGQGGL